MSESVQLIGSDAEQGSLLSIQSIDPSADILTKLVKRLRVLTLTLLPVEVSTEDLDSPTSRIITPEVISAYMAAAGDLVEALPYCLLKTRAEFNWDANHNPADYGENHGRATACEVLARRIVHLSPPDRLSTIMSTRFQHRQVDGDMSDMSSALEMAIDGNCTIFLSSSEAQEVVASLWRGDLVQRNRPHSDIEYVQYEETSERTFWSHLDASRLSVPRYQNMFRVTIWLFFLVSYSQAVREPLERLDKYHRDLDEWEIILYTLALSFLLEDLHKVFKLLRLATWRAFTFWNVIAVLTDGLLAAAFVLRVLGMVSQGENMVTLRLRSFQVLSFVAPLIWMKLVTIFDGYKFIGTMQICIARMLQESGIFFGLLSVLALGFGQGLYALDAADGETEQAGSIVNVLVQALLQAPNYDKFSASPAGLILYYLWNLVTAVVLLNVLISLFSSAYSDIVDDAEAQYLAFFASKTVGMIRAPDAFVYPAPFNLVEIFFVAPFEICRLNADTYAKLNRMVMGFLFFIPLSIIALYETNFDTKKHNWMKTWLRGDDEPWMEDPSDQNPPVEDGDLQISKIPFKELIKVFPNTRQSSEANLMKELAAVKETLATVLEKLDALAAK